MFSPGHTLASDHLCDRRCSLRPRHAVHAGQRHGASDFPGGSANELWASIQEILGLPDETRLFTGHDYSPAAAKPRWESTVAEQKRANPHVAGIDEAAFVALREARDSTLPMPKLILHALQVNIQGGRLPEPEDNGRRYLKIPLDALSGAAW